LTIKILQINKKIEPIIPKEKFKIFILCQHASESFTPYTFPSTHLIGIKNISVIGIYITITIKSIIEFINDDKHLNILEDELNKICKITIKHNIKINTKKKYKTIEYTL
jgi:hypothetical protein